MQYNLSKNKVKGNVMDFFNNKQPGSGLGSSFKSNKKIFTGNSYDDVVGSIKNQDGTTRDLGFIEYQDIMKNNRNAGDITLDQNFMNSLNPENGLGNISDLSNYSKTFGNIASGVAGLGSLYYAKKNFDLEKEKDKYLKDRESQSDARKQQFAKNVGNNASYNI